MEEARAQPLESLLPYHMQQSLCEDTNWSLFSAAASLILPIFSCSKAQ